MRIRAVRIRAVRIRAVRSGWRLVCVALLLLAASCASESAPTVQADQSANSTESGEAAATDQAGSSSTIDDAETNESAPDTADDEEEDDDDAPPVNETFESPINVALGFDPADQLELNNNFIREAEELVRACMADAGFEYTPLNPGFAQSFERQLELEATLSTDEFIAQYGFGISTLFELNFQDEGVLAFVEQLLGPPPAEERSPSEFDAYELALNGEAVAGLSAEAMQDQAFDGGPAPEGSCRRIGYDAAENPQGDIFDGFQSLLGDELDTLNDRFEADQRVRDVRREWQGCMAEAGYSYEGQPEIQDEINERANDIGGRFQQSPEALAIFAAAIDANLAIMDQSERFDFLEQAGALQGFSMVPALQAELDDLIAFELEVASLSASCNDVDELLAVRLELEQDFVETYGDQLALITSGEG